MAPSKGTKYVEDKLVTLTDLTLGHATLGDLWDCHKSLTAGNLFSGDLNNAHYVDRTKMANALTLHRILNPEDVFNRLELKEVSLESSSEHLNSALYFCHYDMQTSEMNLRQSSRAVIDENIKAKIMKGEIKATHIVTSVILGAEVNAYIILPNQNEIYNADMKAIQNNTLAPLKLTAEVKNHLTLMDKGTEQKKIIVRSKPPTSTQPETFKAMFDLIDKFDQFLRNEKTHKLVAQEIYEVPLVYKLTPITDFINFYSSKIYVQIDDKLEKRLRHLLFTLNDCESGYAIRKMLLQRDIRYHYILSDMSNILTMAIIEKECRLKASDNIQLSKLANFINVYITGEEACKDSEMMSVGFEKEMNSMFIFQSIYEFKHETYHSIGSLDTVCISTEKLTLFSDKECLASWLEAGSGLKILLTLGNKPSTNITSKFHEFSCKPFKKYVEVGLAFQNVEHIPSLTIKLKSNQIECSEENILLALEILLISLYPESNSILSSFHNMVAILNNISLPIENHLNHFNRFVDIMKPLEKIKVFTTRPQMLNYLSLQDNVWKFIITLDAKISAYEATEKIIHLSNYYKDTLVECSIGTFEIEQEYDSPLVFLFHKGKFEAVLFDDLDMLILSNITKGENIDSSTIQLLSLNELENSCLYPQKYKYILRVSAALKTCAAQKQELKITQLFPRTKYLVLPNALNLVIAYLNSDGLMVLSAMAQICYEIHVNLRPTLTNIRSCIETGKKCKTFVSLSYQLQNAAYKQFPAILKLMETIDSLKNSISGGNELILDSILKDDQWPKNIKDIMCGYADLSATVKKTRIIELLDKFCKEMLNETKQTCVSIFIKCLQIFGKNKYGCSSIKDDILSFIQHACNDYWCQIFPNETKTETMKKCTLEEAINSNNMYHLVDVLNLVQENDTIFSLKINFEKLYADFSIDIVKSIKDSTLTENQNELLWANRKLLFYFQQNILNHRFLQTINSLICKPHIPKYIPDFIRKEIKSLISKKDIQEYPDHINEVSEIKHLFENIVASGVVFENFMEKFRQTLQNQKLRTELEKCGALIFWDGKKFTDVWGLNTFKDSLKNMKKYYDELKSFQRRKSEAHPPTLKYSKKSTEGNRNSEVINVQDMWAPLTGKTLTSVTPELYLKLRSLKEKSAVRLSKNDAPIKTLLPIVLQQLKSWGISSIQPQILNALMPEIEVKKNTSNAVMTARQRMALMRGNETNVNGNVNQEVCSSVQLSRIDILTCIVQICSPTVVDDILRIISQFPVSLPLIVPSIVHKNEYKLLHPLLYSVNFKWETVNKSIQNNSLFTNPFKMIVAIRLGETAFGKPGKSTILNQLFNVDHVFSSAQEPGSFRGKPVSLPGLVEFIVLSQDSCKGSFWQTVVAAHYQSNDDVLLMANLHGDALKFPETIRFLKELQCSFIVFLMPQEYDEAEKNLTDFETIIAQDVNDKSLLVVSSGTTDIGSCFEEAQKIDTSRLTDDYTISKVREVVKSVLSNTKACSTMPKLTNNNISLAEEINTRESILLILLVKKMTCSSVKKCFQLQKSSTRCVVNFDAYNDIWHNDKQLQNLIRMFARILSLPIHLRRLGIHHLNRNISLLSNNESAECRSNIIKLKKEFRSRLDSYKQNFALQGIKDKLTRKYEQLDTLSLGLEHFFRELGRVYEIAQCGKSKEDNSLLLSMPKMCAELLLDGTVIEILDGDIGDINGPWFNSICNHIHERHPCLSVFVISVLGLQSSGKSTLLNALFGCQFAVSAGRCTKGLFMRMIFLEEKLAKELKVCAIILIDTEGLGAPEKVNDENAERNDRLMATFAMSISNLTIINVQGEAYNSLTEILQIVIITMARLDKAEMSPDILMVQHVNERDSSKLMMGLDKFCEALQDAISLVSKKHMELGTTECKSLNTLVESVFRGDILKIFRAFKNGATPNAPPSPEYLEDVSLLYGDILSCCKRSTKDTLFHAWYSLLPTYWSEISEEHFALNFKNIQEMQDFIDRGSKIAQVKQAVDKAFREHRDRLESICRARTNEVLSNQSRGQWEKQRKKLLKDAECDLKSVPQTCILTRNARCNVCDDATMKLQHFFKEIENQNHHLESESTILKHITNTRISTFTELQQRVKALEVKLGKFSEFEAIINEMLKKALANKSQYDTENRKSIVDSMWHELQLTVSDKIMVMSVEQRIKDQVYEDYHLRRHFEDVFDNLGYEVLDNEKAITPKDRSILDKLKSITGKIKVTAPQANEIHTFLNALPHEILMQNTDEKFENGMVKKLYEKVEERLNKFQEQHNVSLTSEFKFKVYRNGLRIFLVVMREKEMIWRNNYDPSVILQNKMEDYKRAMDIRLQYGFQADGEGRVIANAVLEAIKRRSEMAAEIKQRDCVMSQSWIINSENVRLKYFTMLADKVNRGDNSDAVEFFRDPKLNIERWFRRQVDSFKSASVMKEFKYVEKTEFERMQLKINQQQNCQDIVNCVLTYVNHLDGVSYKCDMQFDDDSDPIQLKEIILSTMSSDRQSIMKNVKIQKPSMEESIMQRLGCTESCTWCGSLCWGERGHYDIVDDTKKHNSAHQPFGLAGTHYIESQVLSVNSCDKKEDTSYATWRGTKRTWAETKVLPEFSNWNFAPHYKRHFVNLMRWFFLKLNSDIATKRSLCPASSSELENGGFSTLQLQPILSEMKSMFS